MPEARGDRLASGDVELSVVVLCYRAGESILGVLEPLRGELDASGVPYELVLVANYWADGDDPTPEVVERYVRDHPRAKTVIAEKRGGMGWDMRAGLEAASGSCLVVMDGDAQNPTEDALRAYREMKRTGADVMKGRRIARFDGLHRRALSWIYNALFRLLFRTRGLWDINGKPKGLTRAAWERLELRSDDWFVDAEIVLNARRSGLTIGELPVIFKANEERPSFVRLSAIWEFFRNMAAYRVRGRP